MQAARDFRGPDRRRRQRARTATGAAHDLWWPAHHTADHRAVQGHGPAAAGCLGARAPRSTVRAPCISAVADPMGGQPRNSGWVAPTLSSFRTNPDGRSSVVPGAAATTPRRAGRVATARASGAAAPPTTGRCRRRGRRADGRAGTPRGSAARPERGAGEPPSPRAPPPGPRPRPSAARAGRRRTRSRSAASGDAGARRRPGPARRTFPHRRGGPPSRSCVTTGR